MFKPYKKEAQGPALKKLIVQIRIEIGDVWQEKSTPDRGSSHACRVCVISESTLAGYVDRDHQDPVVPVSAPWKENDHQHG